MISPDVSRALTQSLFEIYTEAENVMLRKVTKRVDRGVKDLGWSEAKLAEVVRLREDLERTLKQLEKKASKEIGNAITQAYGSGYNSANLDLGELRQALSDIKIPLSVKNLILETSRRLDMAHLKILRSTTDAYRDIIAEVSTGVLTGTTTRIQAAQDALDKFAAKGITSFIDKAGRRWEMASYVEASVRGSTGRAAIMGHIDRQQELGRDLVVISDHPSECPKCRPWEGKILSLSGNDPNHTSLSTAISSGLFHINCKHTLTGYIPGLTKVEKDNPDPGGYTKTQEQRHNERMIRKWKRREAVAITPEAKAQAEARILMWQKQQRELLKGTTMRRKYNRESLTQVR